MEEILVPLFVVAILGVLLLCAVRMGRDEHGCPDCQKAYGDVYNRGYGVINAQTGRCTRYPACQDPHREGADMDLEDQFANETGLAYFMKAPSPPPHQS